MMKQFWADIDADKSGAVTFSEFAEWRRDCRALDNLSMYLTRFRSVEICQQCGRDRSTEEFGRSNAKKAVAAPRVLQQHQQFFSHGSKQWKPVQYARFRLMEARQFIEEAAGGILVVAAQGLAGATPLCMRKSAPPYTRGRRGLLPWRAAIVHFDFALRGGIIAGAAFFLDGLSYFSFKWQRLRRMVETLACDGMPFVVGADWIADPRIVKTSGTPRKLRGARCAAILVRAGWPARSRFPAVVVLKQAPRARGVRGLAGPCEFPRHSLSRAGFRSRLNGPPPEKPRLDSAKQDADQGAAAPESQQHRLGAMRSSVLTAQKALSYVCQRARSWSAGRDVFGAPGVVARYQVPAEASEDCDGVMINGIFDIAKYFGRVRWRTIIENASNCMISAFEAMELHMKLLISTGKANISSRGIKISRDVASRYVKMFMNGVGSDPLESYYDLVGRNHREILVDRMNGRKRSTRSGAKAFWRDEAEDGAGKLEA
ncbi:unnamed protein product [Prorocentrum cordatum]|uniref:EF-hand domain-containing protein n=1 Tax=Prorocentrum cordatum TaxID=2364126 RepID=A0ABN9U9Y4_9DINO|nr:unnamed protein product [Polarella glacialis]